MGNDKTGNHIFACALPFVPAVRDSGHYGIAIYHYNFDGALYTYLAARCKEYHIKQAVARAPRLRAAGLDPLMLHNKEWVLHTQCTAHMAHNALKWAMWEIYPGMDHLDDIWA